MEHILNSEWLYHVSLQIQSGYTHVWLFGAWPNLRKVKEGVEDQRGRQTTRGQTQIENHTHSHSHLQTIQSHHLERRETRGSAQRENQSLHQENMQTVQTSPNQGSPWCDAWTQTTGPVCCLSLQTLDRKKKLTSDETWSQGRQDFSTTVFYQFLPLHHFLSFF